jgi:hypothetical protein
MTNTFPNQGYLVVDTIQAAGADLTLNNGVISFRNPAQNICRYLDITKASVTAAVTEQLQVTTLTPVNAANSVYEILIQQFNPVTGETMTFQYSHTTAASGSSATTICDYFRDLINADQLIKIAATDTATLILTAEAGFAQFTVTILQTGGGFTQSTGTAGIVAVGTTAALALQGITVSGTDYTTVHMEWTPVTGATVKTPNGTPFVLDIYLDEDASNYAGLLAKFQYILAGRSVSAGGPANPEVIAYI